MTYILRIFLAAAIPLFAGCSNMNEPGSTDYSVEEPEANMSWIQSNFEKNKWRWEELPDSTPKCDVGDDDPFQCVKEACAHAEGVYNTRNNSCDCDRSQGDVLMFTSRFGGACLPPRPADESYFSSKLPNLLYLENSNPEFQGSIEKNLGLAEQAEDIDTRAVILLLENHFTYETIESHGDMETLLSNVDPDWQKSTGELDIELSKKQVFLETEEAIQFNHPLIKQAQSLIKNRGPYNNFKLSSRDGCRTQCYGEYWEESGDGFVVLRDLFLEGYKVSSKIYFTNSKNVSSYHTLMTLDISGEVNLIYERNSENLDAGIYQHKISVLDPSGSPLLSNKVISPPMQFSMDRKKEFGYPSNVAPSRSMVTVCEWGVSPFTFVDSWDRVVFGPHVSRSTDFSGSVWGWHKNLDREPLVFSKGSYAQFEFGYLPWKARSGSHIHTADVVRTVLGASETATVTSMDYDSCISSDPEQNALLRDDFPGRVVNLSAYSEVSGVSCNDKIDVVKSTENKNLWVFAAGNDFRPTCEREMMKLSNVLSVTSIHPSAPDRIEAGIQRGRNSIDTASFRSLEFGPGTSFAAPVVAGLAADIFLRYPSLTPVLVKQALLLGVEFSGLDVISGGRTVPKKAMQAAGILNDNSYASFAEILLSVYGFSSTDNLRSLSRENIKIRKQAEKARIEIRELSLKLEKIEDCQVQDKEKERRSSNVPNSRRPRRSQKCDQTEDDMSQQRNETDSLIETMEASLAELDSETGALAKKIMGWKNMESHLEWLSEREIER